MFHSTDGLNWTMIGGEVNEESIVLFDPSDNLLSGYFTVGEVGCVDQSAANYAPMAFGGEYECNYDFSQDFSDGLSLVSFYSIDDEDPSIANVMESLDMCYEVITEGEAATLHPILGWVGSLTDIERRSGYWLKCLFDDTYEHLNGKADTTSMVYSIHEGANLLSY